MAEQSAALRTPVERTPVERTGSGSDVPTTAGAQPGTGGVGRTSSVGEPSPRERTRAFAEMFAEHYPRVFGLCLAKLGDRARAEDLTQETFIRAIAALDPFDGRPVWPWLRRVATNLVVDVVRVTHSRPSAVVADLVDASDDGPHLPDFAQLAAERDVLARALGAIPDRQRVALQLRYVRGWSRRDAAAYLDLTCGAFDQLLHRARRSMRREYRRLGVAPTPPHRRDGAAADAGSGEALPRNRTGA